MSYKTVTVRYIDRGQLNLLCKKIPHQQSCADSVFGPQYHFGSVGKSIIGKSHTCLARVKWLYFLYSFIQDTKITLNIDNTTNLDVAAFLFYY